MTHATDPAHRYTHPAPPELAPGAGVIDATRSEAILAGYGLTLAQAVEVELLIASAGNGNAGRTVEGTIVEALDNVLVIELKAGRRTTRVPWSAIALVRDALTHPASY